MPRDCLDFSQRADLTELMDQPCSYEEFRDCLRDLQKVNSVTGSYRPTLSWLQCNFSSLGRRLHIVDVGCGRGDMLRQVDSWARKRGISVQLTGIDLNPYATAAAREAAVDGEYINWLTGDAFSYRPAEGIDLVISSLFTHHLSHDEIVRFLAWMEANARAGWFINDLHRHWLPYYYFSVASRIFGWHRFVQNDGPVSIRRSFSRCDWERLCAEAGLPKGAAAIEWHRSFRLCVSRVKPN